MAVVSKNILQFWSSPYLKNIFSVSLGSFLAQIINFFANIIIARIYSPQEYGVFAVFNYILGILLVFGNFKLDINVLIEKNISSAHYYIKSSFYLSILFSLISLIIFYFYSHFNHYDFDFLWYVLFALMYVLMVNNQVNWMYLNRMREYTFQGKWRVIESIISNIGIMAFHHLHSIGIVLGYFVSNLIVFLGLSKKTKLFQYLQKNTTDSINHSLWQDIKNNSFIVYQSLLETMQFSLIPILFADYLNIVAMYSMSIRILQVPVRVIILPLTQVFMSQASEYIHQHQPIKNFCLKNFYLVLAVLLPIALIVLFGGNFIFQILLGKQWHGTSDIANILLIWIMTDTLKSPFVQLFYIFKEQKTYFYFYLTGISGILIVYLISNLLKLNAVSQIFAISVFETIVIILILIYIYKMIVFYEKNKHDEN